MNSDVVYSPVFSKVHVAFIITTGKPFGAGFFRSFIFLLRAYEVVKNIFPFYVKKMGVFPIDFFCRITGALFQPSTHWELFAGKKFVNNSHLKCV